MKHSRKKTLGKKNLLTNLVAASLCAMPVAAALTGCTAGKDNPNARTWQYSKTSHRIVINNASVIYPVTENGNSATALLRFAITNNNPGQVAHLKEIRVADGTGGVALTGNDVINGAEALYAPTPPPSAAANHPAGIKAVITDQAAKLRPGLTVPLVFVFHKTNASGKTEEFSIELNAPVREEADVNHTFEQQDFDHSPE